MEGKVVDYKLVRHFHIDNGVLYHKTPTGILERDLSKEEAHYQAQRVHEQICGVEGAPLVRQLL